MSLYQPWPVLMSQGVLMLPSRLICASAQILVENSGMVAVALVLLLGHCHWMLSHAGCAEM